LHDTQEQLIESEKMASLGGLVAGMAHEINTPLGVSVTASSTVMAIIKTFIQELKTGHLKKSTMNQFISDVEKGFEILESNLYRAVNLITNFKHIAVYQSVDEIKKIDIIEYFNEVLTSLSPQWKKASVKLVTDFPKHLMMTTYPGALTQLLTNLVDNSLKHAFIESEDAGEIHLSVRSSNQYVFIDYKDNGKGIPEEILQKVFEPFFTTQRSKGGIGLGMHVVYNLVTQKLKGKINLSSKQGEGFSCAIQIPNTIKPDPLIKTD
jgi:signal transduction histidine kinase